MTLADLTAEERELLPILGVRWTRFPLEQKAEVLRIARRIEQATRGTARPATATLLVEGDGLELKVSNW